VYLARWCSELGRLRGRLLARAYGFEGVFAADAVHVRSVLVYEALSYSCMRP